jgi:hypothetical protein
LQALADHYLPEVSRRALTGQGPFSGLETRTEIHGLNNEIARRLDAMLPDSYRTSVAANDAARQFAQRVDAHLNHVNSDTNGLLNVELGLSPFSPAPEGERVTIKQEAPANLFG